VREGAVGRALSVVRQGLTLGLEFGAHSVEALLWVAETVESSVYEAGSLTRTEGGVRFRLANPPLRTGAFAALRLRWNGTWLPPESVRFRVGAVASWRSADSVSATDPVDLRAGVPVEFELRIPGDLGARTADVRLELDCPAIPPLVWVEFRDEVG